ncbi:MAG: HNH endonuclease, partial [Methanosarcinales archaeon]|nr:HNH endonuclease [Methanosarcinales archaeon]
SVSNYGRVRNDKRQTFLSPRDLRGYKRVSLWYNSKANDHRIHRLVAQAFIQNIEEKAEVNHKNGIKTDNRSSELEWATSSENNKHAFKIGLQNNSGDNNPQSKLSKNDVLEIRELILNHSNKNIGKMFKVSAATISDIKTRKTWRCV